MFFMKKLDVSDAQRVLLYRRGRFKTVLAPGRYWFWLPGQGLQFESLSLAQSEVTHPNLDLLLQRPAFCDAVNIWQVGPEETAVIWRDNLPLAVLAPGSRYVSFKDGPALRIERFALADKSSLPNVLLSALLREGLVRVGTQQAVAHLSVPEQSLGLLFENGELIAELPPGRYGYWAFNRELQMRLFELTWQSLEVSGQEILTKDRVSLRINLSAAFRVVVPLLAAKQVKKVDEFLYRRLQLALREVVGTRTLDGLLADKDAVSKSVARMLGPVAQELGVELADVGVKDIILPGEMKAILNQVVEAQKAAEANLIRRREETAATRSLGNTAKMMEASPVLLRLKELESLEKVVERVGHLNVYGGLEQLMTGLVKLTSENKA
ncbi:MULTISPECIES: slipin family protein [Gammaproteobacteria]|uniref:slipin family protein n=1 Tax=Gammaproteobacteria TaxID=1236 RepID=UPI003A916F4D